EHDFKGDWTEAFIQIANDNISPPFVSIDGYLEISCPAPDGITPIKNALKDASNADEEVEIKVQYVSAPRYRLQVRAMDYKVAEEAMKNAANRAIEYIKKYNGHGVFHRKET
ncbi:MAG: translation initiation factor IF-2 subunit alpha, partial [Candidatus Thorarchaeota archaeon]